VVERSAPGCCGAEALRAAKATIAVELSRLRRPVNRSIREYLSGYNCEMWNPFRKAPPVQPKPSVTDASAVARAEAILAGMDQTEPNGHAQTMMALANVAPLYSAMRSQYRTDTKDFTRDDLVRLFEKMVDDATDQPDRWKRMWYWSAALVYSLENGKGDPQVEDQVVQIFIKFADAAHLLGQIAENSVLWNESEKMLFADGLLANRRVIMQLYLPKPLQRHPRAQEYAKLHDFWLSRV
jgi:hypothetical protein